MLKKRIRAFISILLCCLFCFSIDSFAENDIQDSKDIFPEKYSTISSMSCSLSISGINSVSFAVLRTNSSTTLKIKMELQKIKSGTYTTIETWNYSKTGTVISADESRLINILCTYRLKVTFTAGTETIVSYAYP